MAKHVLARESYRTWLWRLVAEGDRTTTWALAAIAAGADAAAYGVTSDDDLQVVRSLNEWAEAKGLASEDAKHRLAARSMIAARVVMVFVSLLKKKQVTTPEIAVAAIEEAFGKQTLKAVGICFQTKGFYEGCKARALELTK